MWGRLLKQLEWETAGKALRSFAYSVERKVFFTLLCFAKDVLLQTHFRAVLSLELAAYIRLVETVVYLHLTL